MWVPSFLLGGSGLLAARCTWCVQEMPFIGFPHTHPMEKVLLYRKPDFLPYLMVVRDCSTRDGHTALGRYLASRTVLAGHHRISGGSGDRSSRDYLNGDTCPQRVPRRWPSFGSYCGCRSEEACDCCKISIAVRTSMSDMGMFRQSSQQFTRPS
jgi:hypothetical protein